ncbi:hypothetical protein ACN6MT_11240 [Neobacillus niacini]|uniref:hypothetical protein n=1 Tax=Neobacillus niacini TaxID=86668 RepID=UPI003B024C38
MLNSRLDSNHQIYTDGLKNLKRLMVVSEFIMSSDLEDQYLNFLKEIISDKEWLEYKDEILEEIEIYEITDEEITQELQMSSFIKIPLLV